jgi:hypothetical protein
MSSGPITEQQIVEALLGVPAERWGEVLNFLDMLQPQTAASPKSPIHTARDLLQSGLVGIWADRSDLGDSREFARRLREQAERRGGGANAAGH